MRLKASFVRFRFHARLRPGLDRFQPTPFQYCSDARCGHGLGAGRGAMEKLNQEYLAVARHRPFRHQPNRAPLLPLRHALLQ